MKLLVATLLLALSVWLAQPAAAQDPLAPSTQNEARDSRKILVMLKMPASHYRAGARYSGRYDDPAAQSARRKVAARIARENHLELVEGWPMPLIGVDCYVMSVLDGQSIDSATKRLSRYRQVSWSQPLQDFQTLAAPKLRLDPLFQTQPVAAEWHLAKLHELATGKGVTIAVIDSKIEVAHPDLAGQFSTDRDFVTDRSSAAEGHGTAIAGVIGAISDNGVGISGIAPGARMMALRACWERRSSTPASSCDTLSLAKALQSALDGGADIINMSLSGPPDRLLSALIDIGLSRRVAIVAAFDPLRPSGGFPASVRGVVAVADESLPSVPEPVFRAPGKDIPTTQPGGRWYLVNGSSFAAAHVSGLLALFKEERRTAPRPGSIARAPSGIVDACATLITVTSGCACDCAITKVIASRTR